MSGDPHHTESKNYVLALDVGTSNIRAHIYDNEAIVRGTGTSKVIQCLCHVISTELFAVILGILY